MSPEPASQNNLTRLLTPETQAELRELARWMRTDLKQMGEVISEEVLFKERLLARTVTQLVEAASSPHITLEEAVKVLTAAAKIHSEWQSSVAPIARKLGEDIRRLRKEIESKGGDRVGKAILLDPLADLVTGTADEEDAIRDRPELALTDRRLEALDRWSKDPWSFLTGVDPDTNAPIIRTIDQRSKEPIRAYPSHLAYCHYLIDLLETGHHLQIEKASQMIVTTTISLWAFSRTVFHTAHKTLLSKHNEEEAATILDEKIRQPWLLMPDWLRVALPITLKPKNKITAAKTGGIILGLPENAAAADARGQTYQLGLIDEADFQASLRELLTAMLPRARQVVFWSTPGTAGEGVRVFGEYLKDDPIRPHPELVELKKKYAHVRGMSIRRNEEKNITSVRIEHTSSASAASLQPRVCNISTKRIRLPARFQSKSGWPGDMVTCGAVMTSPGSSNSDTFAQS